MSRARTQEQITAAWEARSLYLQANPDDEAILEEGESLWMLEQALKYADTHTIN